VAENSQCDAVVTSVDYFPTLLDVAGCAPPAGQTLDGVSLFPLFSGDELSRESIFSHFPHYIKATGNLPNTSVRRGRWKLYRFYCDGEAQADRYELYDLVEDIGESKNLAGAMSDKVATLDQEIDEFLESTEALVPVANPRYRPPVDGWFGNDWAEISRAEGQLAVRSIGQDPFLTTTAMPTVRGPIKVIIRMRSASRGGGRLFWSTRDRPGFHRGVSVDFRVEHDEAWHEYAIRVPVRAHINGLRLDPSTAEGEIAIDKITVQDGGGTKHWTWDFD
jgi:hypothetical protein